MTGLLKTLGIILVIGTPVSMYSTNFGILIDEDKSYGGKLGMFISGEMTCNYWVGFETKEFKFDFRDYSEWQHARCRYWRDTDTSTAY